MRPPVPVVLDCDTGTDDAVAILAAALHPGVDLLGVCTGWGNADVEVTTDNTLRTLDLVGAGAVPVVPGLNGPFRGRATPLPSGRTDIPTALDLPAATSTAVDGFAPDWLADVARRHPEPVTLVTTGTLSNLAEALDRHPDLAGRLGRVVALAGTHERDGVAPLVERNVWCDPDAAAAVLGAVPGAGHGAGRDAGLRDLTLVTMDATFSAALDAAAVAALRGVGTPAAAATAAFVEQRMQWYAGPAPLHDPLALVAVVAPHLLTTRRADATVETTDGPAYGRTRFAWHGDGNGNDGNDGNDGNGGDGGNGSCSGASGGMRVALRADRDGYLAWLCDVLGGAARR